MLPGIFKPGHEADLIRIGNKNDGGYVIPKPVIEKTDLVIGFGLCNDWSFEEHFQSLSQCKVVCYDHTVNKIFWVRKLVEDSLGCLIRKRKISDIFKFLSYKRYFDGKDSIHVPKMIGPNIADGMSVADALKGHDGENIFLKVDIEGWEYRIIDELTRLPENVLGLVIEFHDVDLHQDLLKDFIAKSGLKLVHVHANNYGLVDQKRGPIVVEMTFCREDFCTARNGDDIRYPIAGLDFPNNPHRPDIPLSFRTE